MKTVTLKKGMVKPGKRSGFELKPGKTTELVKFRASITNTGDKSLYIDFKTVRR
jgi:hypothetical protein